MRPMPPSAAPDSPPPQSIASETAENHLQPFFVLHKAFPRKPGSRKTKKKVDLHPGSPKSGDMQALNDGEDRLHEQLRVEAFDLVWSKTETAAKEVLWQININVFADIYCWVCKSFEKMRSFSTCNLSKAKRSLPSVVGCICKQIFTALILTKNIEFVDDILTFKELGAHLTSQGCHAANLSSTDFSVKNGIGGCVRGLLRQLTALSFDAADVAILAAWYSEPENYDHPVVIIIDDLERCNSTILAEFIVLLSEWVVQIPFILIAGVSTTTDASMKLLPSNALQCLNPRNFTLGLPTERMDAIIEHVLVKQYSGFGVGHEIAVFLRKYFLKHDGTVASFIKALKIACAKHFFTEPLSFLGPAGTDDDSKVAWEKKCEMLPEKMLKYAFNLPSCQREGFIEMKGETLARGLLELNKLRRNWSSVVLCIYEVGKIFKMQLLDIFCEALNPDLCNSMFSDYFGGGGKVSASCSPVNCGLHSRDPRQSFGHERGSCIVQVLRKVRDLPGRPLSQLLQIWGKLTEEMPEVNHNVKELQSALRCEDAGTYLKHRALDSQERSSSRHHSNMEKGAVSVPEKAAMLLECMIRDYMKPLELKPFHEIVCFKNVGLLQSALIGDPRRTVQVDLLKSHEYLKCSCCSNGGNLLLPSMHDSSIIYRLAQEHGDLINLHDWYQSFKSTISGSSSKTKHRMQQSPKSKKRKATNEPVEVDEASIEARFCRAATDLQLTGLLRMPTKRRPDYVQRVAFGL